MISFFDERQDSCSCRHLSAGRSDSLEHLIVESSRSLSACCGGADKRDRDDDGLDEEDDDAQPNMENIIITPSTSNQPMPKQLSVFLKEQKLEASDKRQHTKQLMRNYEERGRSSWHFDPDDMGYVLAKFVIPYIFESDTW